MENDNELFTCNCLVNGLTPDQWYAEVVRLCKEQGLPEWFYADKDAWLEHYADEHDTPQQAIDYNVECAS